MKTENIEKLLSDHLAATAPALSEREFEELSGWRRECIPIPRIAKCVRQGLTSGEATHVQNCRFCTNSLTAAYRLIGCPSFATLIRYQLGSLPEIAAVKLHVERDQCAKCRLLLVPAAAVAKIRWAPKIVWESLGFNILPHSLPALGADRDASENVFDRSIESEGGKLVAWLRQEWTGNLVLRITSADVGDAGKSVFAVLTGGQTPKGCVSVQLTLKVPEHLRSQGVEIAMVEHDFGPFEQFAETPGSSPLALAFGYLK